MSTGNVVTDFDELHRLGLVDGGGAANAQGIKDYVDAQVSTPILFSTTVPVSNAQVLALRTTPLEMVPAPGAGKFLMFLAGFYNWSITSAYTNIDSGAAWNMGYGGGTGRQFGTIVNDGDNAFTDVTTMLTNGGGWIAPPGYDASDIAAAGWGVIGNLFCPVAETLEDKSIILRMTNGLSGNLGGGNAANTLRVTILYAIADI